MSDLPGLRKEPLFGRKERLYESLSNEKEEVRPVTVIKPKKDKDKDKPQPEARVVVAESVDEVDEGGRTLALVSTGFELLGIAALTVGGFLVAQWLGFMILGVLLIALGVATGYGV